MAARRNKIPPYEIMGPGGRLTGQSTGRGDGTGGGGVGGPGEQVGEGAEGGGAASGWRVHWSTESREVAGETGGHSGPAAWWAWSRAGVPITLRVPRGVAIVVLVGVIGLLVLAYWVGYERGGAAASRQAQAMDTGPTGPRDAPPAPASNRGAGASDAADTGSPAGENPTGPTGRDAAGPAADPRAVGLNYFIVARRRPPDARKLADFLEQQGGVETYVDPLDNGYSLIWVVDRGFRADELGSEAYNAFQRRLRELGRAWKRHNDGKGADLGDMYVRKYKG